MKGQLWEPCPICNDEPVCTDCGLCHRHCECDKPIIRIPISQLSKADTSGLGIGGCGSDDHNISITR